MKSYQIQRTPHQRLEQREKRESQKQKQKSDNLLETVAENGSGYATHATIYFSQTAV